MTALPSPGEDVRADATRMRALCACPSIAMHGSAGVDAKGGGRLYPCTPGQVHFGADLLDGPDRHPSTVWGRHALAAIADDRLAVEGLPVPGCAVGVDERVDAARFGALMRLPRIRVMDARGAPAGSDGLRAEFWPAGTPHASGQDDPAQGRAALAALADRLALRPPPRRLDDPERILDRGAKEADALLASLGDAQLLAGLRRGREQLALVDALDAIDQEAIRDHVGHPGLHPSRSHAAWVEDDSAKRRLALGVAIADVLAEMGRRGIEDPDAR